MINLNKRLDRVDKISYRYKKPKKVWLRRIWVILLLLFILILIPSVFIYFGSGELVVNAKSLINGYKGQNFDLIESGVTDTKKSLQKVNFGLNLLFWFKIIPIVGGYYSDILGFTSAGVEELKAMEKLVTKLKGQKTELGFDGNPKSGPERMTQAIKILDKIQPYLPEVEKNLEKAANSVGNISTDKYPQKINNKDVRINLETAKNFITGASVAITKGKDALTYAPGGVGLGSPKTYLLLFQNDKEIRPTGGFITAYATLTLNNGQVSSSTSDDIYRLDEELLKVCLTKICPLTPPSPIVKYLPEVSGKPRSAWSMRDSNISPDLPTAAEEFERMYELLDKGLPFDGIIYIDTQVVEELIGVTGPIDVYDTKYSAEVDKRCNCPNVVYELESYAEIAAKGEQDRKAVLGVLMQQILAKITGADVEKLPVFIETIARLSNHKHIMFFAHDTKLQQALSKLDWTGEIKQFDGDYFHINDSNFAGGKSNLYVEQTVTQDITTQKDGTVKKKLTIEYKNPQAFNTWLNGINRDYVRVYVPKGSELISSKGSEVEVTTIEDDLGKTVFEAFIQVRPQNSRKLEMEFSVPYDPKGEYKLMVQKQPGAKDFHYIIKINGSKKADFKLDQDKELKLDL